MLVGAGCAPSPFTDALLPAAGANFALPVGSTIGQTFVAHHAGLQGLSIFLRTAGTGDALLTLHLRASALDDTQDVAVARLNITLPAPAAWYDFAFAPIPSSHDQSYYFFLEPSLPPGAALFAGTTAGASFLDGALYLNGDAQDAQLAFKADFDLTSIAADLWAWLAQTGAVLVAATFLFVLPGLALQIYCRPSANTSLTEQVTLAIGISLAIYPVLMLWTNLVGLYLGPLYAWLPGCLGALLLAVHLRGWRPVRRLPIIRARQLAEPAFWFVCLLVVLVRLFVIRGLQVPLWGDSYQHTMIAQLLVDHGGLFDSWQPYSDLQTFTYHFGFHTAVAAFHWLSGWPLSEATLWTGQLVNVFAVIALYPLAVRVSGNRWAAVVAVLIAGLLSPMPMVYLNWGRYTQLAGQAVLPAAVYLTWDVLETKTVGWRQIALAALTIGGLSLTHYRILIFFVLFVVAFVILNVRRLATRSGVLNLSLVTLGGAIIFAPWFVHVFRGFILRQFALQINTPADLTPTYIQQANGIGDLANYMPLMLWLAVPFAVAWLLVRRPMPAALITVWWLLILLAANPQWLRLPGEGLLTNFAVFIATYIPVVILVGAGISCILKRDGLLKSAWSSALLMVVVVVLALWGSAQRLGDAQIAQSALVVPPDLKAARWLRENTPSEARFLVNSFAAYGGTLYVGSDGGWWLPLLAGRQSMLPPINYVSEQGPRSDYLAWINALPNAIRDNGVTAPEVISMLKERAITYVYIGQRQGRVNYDGPSVLQPELLLQDKHFQPIYHQDRVWVFQFRN